MNPGLTVILVILFCVLIYGFLLRPLNRRLRRAEKEINKFDQLTAAIEANKRLRAEGPTFAQRIPMLLALTRSGRQVVSRADAQRLDEAQRRYDAIMARTGGAPIEGAVFDESFPELLAIMMLLQASSAPLDPASYGSSLGAAAHRSYFGPDESPLPPIEPHPEHHTRHLSDLPSATHDNAPTGECDDNGGGDGGSDSFDFD